MKAKLYMTGPDGVSSTEFDVDLETRTLSFDGEEYQSVPLLWDTQDYRYTHGGHLFRLACDRFWDIEERKRERDRREEAHP